jgi:hypothetical protein
MPVHMQIHPPMHISKSLHPTPGFQRNARISSKENFSGVRKKEEIPVLLKQTAQGQGVIYMTKLITVLF